MGSHVALEFGVPWCNVRCTKSFKVYKNEDIFSTSLFGFIVRLSSTILNTLPRIPMATKSADLGFPVYVCFCAFIAAISGFNVGWHIGTLQQHWCIHFNCRYWSMIPSSWSQIGVPNMPSKVITECPDGEYTIGGLPSCLPMSSFTW